MICCFRLKYRKNNFKAGVFSRHSCKTVLYVSLYSDFIMWFQPTKNKVRQGVLGLNSGINESFVVLGIETSKGLVKMLLVLLHSNLFSESPLEYFTEPGVTRISSLARTALEYPSIQEILLFYFISLHRGSKIFQLLP